MRLIINADDYGLTPGCDAAIIEAVDAGAVTSVSCLVPGVGYSEKRPPRGKSGVHLRLTDGRPICDDVPSLVVDGEFPRHAATLAMRTVDAVEVYQEWRAQIEWFIAVAGPPTHLDSHHHVHGMPHLQRVYADLCADYGVAGVPLSVRQRDALRARGVKCPDYSEIKWTDGKSETLLVLLSFALTYGAGTMFLMAHPGKADNELHARSSMALVREIEHGVLMSATMKRLYADMGIELIGMGDL